MNGFCPNFTKKPNFLVFSILSRPLTTNAVNLLKLLIEFKSIKFEKSVVVRFLSKFYQKTNFPPFFGLFQALNFKHSKLTQATNYN